MKIQKCRECKREIDTEKEVIGICPHCGRITCEECMKKIKKEKKNKKI